MTDCFACHVTSCCILVVEPHQWRSGWAISSAYAEMQPAFCVCVSSGVGLTTLCMLSAVLCVLHQPAEVIQLRHATAVAQGMSKHCCRLQHACAVNCNLRVSRDLICWVMQFISCTSKAQTSQHVLKPWYRRCDMHVQLLKTAAVQSVYVEASCTCIHVMFVLCVTMHACSCLESYC